MDEQIFRKGDRVFDIRYGWGTIKKYNANYSFPIGVQFDRENIQDIIYYLKSGKDYEVDDIGLLSFTKYDLVNGGFSQERPVNYEDCIEKWGKFWNNISDNIIIDVLDDLCEDCDGNVKFVPYEINSHYDHFEPLTDEQLKVLGLENS